MQGDAIMGGKHSSGNPETDGLPSDGVSHVPASPEQLQVYRDAREALDTYKASVEPLLLSDDPHDKLVVAAFDGTNNDRDQDLRHKTNVARIGGQLETLTANGNEQIHVKYLPGPGTQANPIERTLDSALGFSSRDRVEEMYTETVDKANKWYRADPHVQVHALSTGFSRGGSQAAAFTNVLHERSIAEWNVHAGHSPHYPSLNAVDTFRKEPMP
jgi:hypothetical protein